jgi:hypothetical protein
LHNGARRTISLKPYWEVFEKNKTKKIGVKQYRTTIARVMMLYTIQKMAVTEKIKGKIRR